MLIDWFTVGGQVVNFIILVWLMKRFLYQPVLDAIDAREKRIEAQLSDAAHQKKEAHQEQSEFKAKNDEFDEQRKALFEKATDEANIERQRLLDTARQSVEELSVKQHEALKSNAAKLNKAIGRRIQDEVFAITKKLLCDLAGVDLEERMCETFVKRLRVIDKEAKDKLMANLGQTADPLRIISAYSLSEEQHLEIKKALAETFNKKVSDISIEFAASPDLISGIELNAGGQKVNLSFNGHLNLLEKEVNKVLNIPENSGIEKVQKVSQSLSDHRGVDAHAN